MDLVTFAESDELTNEEIEFIMEKYANEVYQLALIKTGYSSSKATNLKLTLQDGSVLKVPCGWSGDYPSQINGDFDLSSTFRSLINAENVVGIEIYGQYISLKE